MKWKSVNLTWAAYKQAIRYEDRTGFVIKLKSNGPDDDGMLIGNVNAHGGYCDDCSIRDDDVVVAELDLREQIESLIEGAEA